MLQDIVPPPLAKPCLTDFHQHTPVDGLSAGGQSIPSQKQWAGLCQINALMQHVAGSRQEPSPCESPTRLQVLEAYGKLNPSH